MLLVFVFRSNKKPQRTMRCSVEKSTKNQNEQQKAITSNKRHLPILVYEIELVLSQKQEKQEEQRKATNGKWKHAPKTKTSNKKQQRAFSIPIFIHSHEFWTYGRWLISRAMKSEKEQGRATKSNERQQLKATKSNKKQQRTSELEKPKRARKKARRATKGTKSPNGSQALH